MGCVLLFQYGRRSCTFVLGVQYAWFDHSAARVMESLQYFDSFYKHIAERGFSQ